MTQRAILVVSAALAIACGGKDGASDTADSDVVGGNGDQTLIRFVEYPGCVEEAAGKWRYYAETFGWTDGNNVVNAWETGNVDGINEEHPLPSIDYGPDKEFDIIQVDLDAGIDPAAFSEGDNTVFACGVHDVDNVMTFAVRVYDLDHNLADCAIYSSDTVNDGVSMVFAGTAPAGSAVSSEFELTAVNCDIWEVVR